MKSNQNEEEGRDILQNLIEKTIVASFTSIMERIFIQIIFL